MPDDKVSAILKTEDVPGTIEWYRRIGFRLRGVFPETGEPTWCELSCDGVILQVPRGPDAMAWSPHLHRDALLLSGERGRAL